MSEPGNGLPEVGATITGFLSYRGGPERSCTCQCGRSVQGAGERVMDINFECIFEGKKLFRVVKPATELPLFTGTMAQCKRFLDVYNEKARKARHRDRKSFKDVSAST